jgi:hypothetical protein
MPWQLNQDGTNEETLNHLGRQEIEPGLQTRSFANDTALLDYTNLGFGANKKSIRGDGGVFQIKEDPRYPGSFFGIYTGEFGTLTSGQIIRFNGAPGVNPEQMAFADASDAAMGAGRFRNPLPLADGQIIASHTPSKTIGTVQATEFTLKQLALNATTQLYSPGTSLTGGITKSVSWWSPDTKLSYSGKLWELEPVEVVARTRPGASGAMALEAPEKSILAEEGVDEAALRSWLTSNNLALIVTRNQTSRDRADRQQPFNLQVPGGVKTTAGAGKVYDIAHYQVLQADSVRGYSYTMRAGRRPIAQPVGSTQGKNPANAGGPAGSVKIAPDGSTAAFVPAQRALTWQVTDTGGNAVVRERVWITFQPGEVRVCASCHGLNKADQAGNPPPLNKPEALRSLVRYWNTLPK